MPEVKKRKKADGALILAVDQGTTGTKAALFDQEGRMVAVHYRPLPQIYPRPGWVEHDPMEIWHAAMACIDAVLADPETAARVAAIGITNQRETAIAWNRHTGLPVGNAIVWQCRRSAALCDQWRQDGLTTLVAERTGLVIDAYFSGTKWQWLLEEVPETWALIREGDLCFGTVDSWLIWNLTGGQKHVTDWTNASRTMLFDIHNCHWDIDLLDYTGITMNSLPRPVPSSGVAGETVAIGNLPAGIPIAGIAGDQQAALFGQCCFWPGMVKNTYGTGCFVLMPTGHVALYDAPLRSGLLATMAAAPPGEKLYALEGSVFIAGAVIQWLRDELGLLTDAAESEKLAAGVPDTGGVYFVPAFTGLGAPHWDMYARGTILGLTRGTSKAHLVRAALEAMAYQSREVIELMAKESGESVTVLRADGGASANNFLMQFQADILDVEVERAAVLETTALGAAYLAGLGVGLWPDVEAITACRQEPDVFCPTMTPETRAALCRGWERAVERAKNWAD